MTTQIFPFCEDLTYPPNEPYIWSDRGVRKVTNVAASGVRQTRPLAILPRKFGPFVWDQQVNDIGVFEKIRDFYNAHKDGTAFVFFDFDTAMQWGIDTPLPATSGVVQYGVANDVLMEWDAPFRGTPTAWTAYERVLVTDPWVASATQPTLYPGDGTFGRCKISFNPVPKAAAVPLLGIGFTGQRYYMCYLDNEACEVTRYSSTTWTIRLAMVEAVGEVPVA